MRLHLWQPRKKLQEINRQIYGAQHHPGNSVLLHSLKEQGGPGKLQSHWEDTVYVVVSQKSPDIPVYEIKPERGGKSRTVHRNLLLACDSLPVEKPHRQEQNKRCKSLRQKGGEKFNNIYYSKTRT